MLDPKRIHEFEAKPGEAFRLKDHDPRWTPGGEYEKLTEEMIKESAKALLAENLEHLADAQSKLYAHDRWSILVVLQAMDAAGKDGLIKHVMKGLNPQGCDVHSFKSPSPEELDHSFLWRCMRVAPARGKITIFNRSHYEEVLIVKVHPEILPSQKIPDELVTADIWKERYEDINNFELHLARNGTRIFKIFLHVSKAEQKRRFLERLEDPKKHWKFSPADVEERDYWDEYQKAYQEMIEATSTAHAPWYVVPADHKHVARALVSEILTQGIRELRVKYPKVTEEQYLAFGEARKKLLKSD